MGELESRRRAGLRWTFVQSKQTHDYHSGAVGLKGQ